MELPRSSGWFRLKGRMLDIFGRRFQLPESPYKRILIGALFIVGGCLSILPIFGVWMLPLGLLILSIDVALVRRWRRKSEVKWVRWRARRRAGKEPAVPASVVARKSDRIL